MEKKNYHKESGYAAQKKYAAKTEGAAQKKYALTHKQIGIRFSNELYEKLRVMAEEDGCSVQDLIRKAVETQYGMTLLKPKETPPVE